MATTLRQPTTRSQQRTTIWAVIVMMSAFGPYLVGGLRTEQIVIYGSVLLAAGAIALSARTWGHSLVLVLALWSAIASIAIVGAIFSVPVPKGMDPGRLVSGADNMLLPVALLALGGYWLSRLQNTSNALSTVAWTVVYLSAANAAVAVLQFLGAPLEPILSHFWSEGGGSVAIRALGNQRFTGIFNQPGEAGLIYSLALLSLAYLWLQPAKTRRLLYFVLLVSLVAGSLLSQSKIAFLFGIPVVALLLFMRSPRSRRSRKALFSFVGVGLGLGLVAIGAEGWVGSERILGLVGSARGSSGAGALVSGTGGIVGRLSGGRYGSTGTLNSGFAAVTSNEPLFGFGAAGIRVAYDSAWLEILAVSGLIGLALYIALLGYLFVLGLRRWRTSDAAVAVLGLGLSLIAIGGSFGIAPLTANRAGTVFWVLTIFALLGTVHRVPKQVQPAD